ncbi:hypothetical protein ILYODFUR_033616 [Ilyodon furcidens]|uniref:ditrans,polycis-polyprenyl diphosphate synthase [(2E,6E)-farnesyldiphosphate specific] n=1 Tax=Ilyodon furcidens TaxID=33524 RepID=A0ABV0SRA0_9TELE
MLLKVCCQPPIKPRRRTRRRRRRRRRKRRTVTHSCTVGGGMHLYVICNPPIKEKKKNSCRRRSTLYSKTLNSPFKRPEMALLYGLIWRVLLAVVRIKRATVSWLRVRLQTWRGRFWQRTVAALLLPVPVTEFPDYLEKARDYDGKGAESRRSRWISDGNSLKKLPVHIGFVVAEEELSYADIANMVVWCMAVGISHVSVYDHHGENFCLTQIFSLSLLCVRKLLRCFFVFF